MTATYRRYLLAVCDADSTQCSV